MTCTRCGHQNPAENRYCGMCGTRLPQEPAPVTAGDAASPRPEGESFDEFRRFSRQRQPETVRASTTPSFLGLNDAPEDAGEPEETPSRGISGPSFLGLEGPPPSYLLEDDEPRSHWRAWVLLLVIVAVAVLVTLQWPNQVKAGAHKVGSIVWTKLQERLHSTPPQPKVDEKVAALPADQPAQTSSAAAAPAANASGDTSGATANQPTVANPSAAGSDSDQTKAAAPPQENAAPAKAEENSVQEQSAELSTKSSSEATGASSETSPRKAKTSRSARTAGDDSMLMLAQKYLQGRGVPRNCQQGLMYLREAVRQPSSEARSQMGALYATGTCVPQNRVEAYRWFSSALEVDPGNPWLSRERDTLYGQMTSAERQQASR